MDEWQKKRNPDDVPTPVAVAVSDFCRRARYSPAATEVREALSLISEEEDFRIRGLTDHEPEASPLGPFAVIDLLQGTPPSLAAQRQGCGYYELVRRLLRERQERTSAEAPSPVPAPRPTPAAALTDEVKDRISTAPPPPTMAKPAREEKPSIQERIAPKKREPSPAMAEETASALPPGKRELPRPRGRFTRLAVTKRPADELSDETARDYLADLIDQHSHRMSLLRSLGEQYAGRGSAPLSFPDVEPALRHHRLLERLQAKERELILAGYTEHKGANGRVAWALGVSPPELEKLVRSLGITDAVAELRERSKREALASQHLTYRLDLLGRTRYLADLGIQKRFAEALARDLRGMLQTALPEATDIASLAEVVGRKYGAPAELVSRAMDRLGLTEEFRKRIPSETAPYSH